MHTQETVATKSKKTYTGRMFSHIDFGERVTTLMEEHVLSFIKLRANRSFYKVDGEKLWVLQINELCEKVRRSKRHVYRIIAKLEKMGLIAIREIYICETRKTAILPLSQDASKTSQVVTSMSQQTPPKAAETLDFSPPKNNIKKNIKSLSLAHADACTDARAHEGDDVRQTDIEKSDLGFSGGVAERALPSSEDAGSVNVGQLASSEASKCRIMNIVETQGFEGICEKAQTLYEETITRNLKVKEKLRPETFAKEAKRLFVSGKVSTYEELEAYIKAVSENGYLMGMKPQANNPEKHWVLHWSWLCNPQKYEDYLEGSGEFRQYAQKKSGDNEKPAESSAYDRLYAVAVDRHEQHSTEARENARREIRRMIAEEGLQISEAEELRVFGRLGTINQHERGLTELRCLEKSPVIVTSEKRDTIDTVSTKNNQDAVESTLHNIAQSGNNEPRETNDEEGNIETVSDGESAVREGHSGVNPDGGSVSGTIKTIHDQAQAEHEESKMSTHDSGQLERKQELEGLREDRITEIRHQNRSRIRQYADNLEGWKLEDARKAFEDYCESLTDETSADYLGAKQFRETGWRTPFISVQFESFVGKRYASEIELVKVSEDETIQNIDKALKSIPERMEEEKTIDDTLNQSSSSQNEGNQEEGSFEDEDVPQPIFIEETAEEEPEVPNPNCWHIEVGDGKKCFIPYYFNQSYTYKGELAVFDEREFREFEGGGVDAQMARFLYDYSEDKPTIH